MTDNTQELDEILLGHGAEEGEFTESLKQAVINWHNKQIEVIIGQAEPGTWVDPDDTDDLEWQGYVKGVQDYKDNLHQALYGKDEK